MIRHLCAAVLAAALPLALAGQEVPPLDDSEIVVATVNGEAITRAQLEKNWNRLNPKTRSQYEQSGGGKAGFLETMILKRLIVLEALKHGLDKRQEVIDELEAAREAALFDVYVREVVASDVITDEAMRAYYDSHSEEFRTRELVKLRIIAISQERRTRAEARGIALQIMQDLFSLKNQVAAGGDFAVLVNAFGNAAIASSEHESAQSGGDLGWLDPDLLDATLANAARQVSPKSISGLIETPSGYALLLVEDRRPPALAPFEDSRAVIRQKVLAQSGKEIMDATNRLTRQLRSAAKVNVLPENLQ